MNINKTYLLLIIIFILSLDVNSQSNKDFRDEFKQQTFFGVRTSIIVPDDIILKKEITKVSDNTKYSLETRPSYIFGMGIKHNFTKHYSFNTGINFVRRTYIGGFESPDTSISRKLKFISYELPVSGSVYVRLTDKIYMNTSAGLLMNYFPSDIIVENIYGLKFRFMTFASIINVGWEYRTKKNGYFYIGASYKRDFENMLNVLYYKNDISGIANEYIITKGDYISIDFIYYLPQNLKRR